MEQSQILQRFHTDSEWFHKHINKLREKGFTGKFVAIKNSRALASSENINSVLDELESKGEDSSMLFIEFVHPEGYTLIL